MLTACRSSQPAPCTLSFFSLFIFSFTLVFKFVPTEYYNRDSEVFLVGSLIRIARMKDITSSAASSARGKIN